MTYLYYVLLYLPIIINRFLFCKFITFQVGDFLFYCILGQNINILQFRDVLKSLSLRLHTGDDNLPMGAAAGTNITINSSNKLRLN